MIMCWLCNYTRPVGPVSHSRGHTSYLLRALLWALIQPEVRSAQVPPADAIFWPPSATSHIPFHHRPLVCFFPIFLSFSSPSLVLYFHVEQQPCCEHFADVPCETGAQAHACIQTAGGSGRGARSHQKPRDDERGAGRRKSSAASLNRGSRNYVLSPDQSNKAIFIEQLFFAIYLKVSCLRSFHCSVV